MKITRLRYEFALLVGGKYHCMCSADGTHDMRIVFGDYSYRYMTSF